MKPEAVTRLCGCNALLYPHTLQQTMFGSAFAVGYVTTVVRNQNTPVQHLLAYGVGDIECWLRGATPIHAILDAQGNSIQAGACTVAK